MGTSGSYGGSGSTQWSTAHDAFDALPDSLAPGAGAGDPTDSQQQVLDAALQALAVALQKDDAEKGVAPAAGYPLSALVASLRGGGGAGGAGSGGAGPGRAGGGSSRQVLKGASRGAAAVAGAHALRNGNADQLRELGLDLDELRGLPRRTQISRILQAVLGDAGHPDDAALRRATAQHVKDVILSPEPPSPEDSLRGLVALWIYELGLVELSSQKAHDSLTPQDVVRKQGWLRSWLQRRVRGIPIPDAKRMTVQEFSATAAKVTGEALRMLRAKRS